MSACAEVLVVLGERIACQLVGDHGQHLADDGTTTHVWGRVMTRPSGTPAPYPWGLAELIDRRPELAGIGVAPMLLDNAAGAA